MLWLDLSFEKMSGSLMESGLGVLGVKAGRAVNKLLLLEEAGV